MDSFVGQVEQRLKCGSFEPACSPCKTNEASRCLNMVGYHDAWEIPNYWIYAESSVVAPSSIIRLPALRS